jgi:uncharacterized membrane protein YebE (DUF533 family)
MSRHTNNINNPLLQKAYESYKRASEAERRMLKVAGYGAGAGLGAGAGALAGAGIGALVNKLKGKDVLKGSLIGGGIGAGVGGLGGLGLSHYLAKNPDQANQLAEYLDGMKEYRLVAEQGRDGVERVPVTIPQEFAEDNDPNMEAYRRALAQAQPGEELYMEENPGLRSALINLLKSPLPETTLNMEERMRLRP